MSANLISRDIDTIVTKFVITTGHPQDRTLNAVMVVFRCPNFVRGCFQRYMMLMTRYLKIQSLPEVVNCRQWKINDSSFWHGMIKKFASNTEVGTKIVLNGGQKGSTRMKLYILGILFGYSHVIHGQKEWEVSSGRHGRTFYVKDRLMKDKYTMKELQRIRMHLPQMWKETEEVDEHGEHYYVKNDLDDCGRGWYKRGFMHKGPGLIEFTKIVVLGNEEVMATEIFMQLSLRRMMVR